MIASETQAERKLFFPVQAFPCLTLGLSPLLGKCLCVTVAAWRAMQEWSFKYTSNSGSPLVEYLIWLLKPPQVFSRNQFKWMLCPGTNCSCPGLKCHLRSDPELWPGQPNLPAHDDISTLIWELHKKRCFCDLLVLVASTHQTPGQLGQEKTDAAVTEVSRSALREQLLKHKKIQDSNPAPGVKGRFVLFLRVSAQEMEKVSIFSSSCPLQTVLEQHLPGKHFIPRWETFSTVFCSRGFHQTENTASLCFLSLLMVNAPWNDFTTP